MIAGCLRKMYSFGSPAKTFFPSESEDAAYNTTDNTETDNQYCYNEYKQKS